MDDSFQLNNSLLNSHSELEGSRVEGGQGRFFASLSSIQSITDSQNGVLLSPSADQALINAFTQGQPVLPISGPIYGAGSGGAGGSGGLIMGLGGVQYSLPPEAQGSGSIGGGGGGPRGRRLFPTGTAPGTGGVVRGSFLPSPATEMEEEEGLAREAGRTVQELQRQHPPPVFPREESTGEPRANSGLNASAFLQRIASSAGLVAPSQLPDSDSDHMVIDLPSASIPLPSLPSPHPAFSSSSSLSFLPSHSLAARLATSLPSRSSSTIVTPPDPQSSRILSTLIHNHSRHLRPPPVGRPAFASLSVFQPPAPPAPASLFSAPLFVHPEDDTDQDMLQAPPPTTAPASSDTAAGSSLNCAELLQSLDQMHDQGKTVSSVSKDVWGVLLSLSSKYPTFQLTKRTAQTGQKGGYLLGRHRECDIRLDHLQISNRHCQIYTVHTDGVEIVYIEDLSTNGTFVNGVRLRRHDQRRLYNDDTIMMTLGQPDGPGGEPHSDESFVFQDVAALRNTFDNPSGGRIVSPAEAPRARFDCNYLLLHSLGAGSFADVHIAVNRLTGEQFAVKIINKKRFQLNPRVIQTARLEFQILMSMKHPCVIAIHGVYEEADSLYMILEYARDGELFDEIIQRQQFTEQECRVIFFQLFMAIKYLHDRNVVHRDLKPENILLADKESLTIKLTDFGLAKVVTENAFMKTLCGTPNYVAPEVLVPGHQRSYSKAVDMWSLGVILYICLCGYPPFADDFAPPAMQHQIKNAIYRFLPPKWDHVSDEAKDLVSQLLLKDYGQRLPVEQALRHPWLNAAFDGQNYTLNGQPFSIGANEVYDLEQQTQTDTPARETKPLVTPSGSQPISSPACVGNSAAPGSRAAAVPSAGSNGSSGAGPTSALGLTNTSAGQHPVFPPPVAHGYYPEDGDSLQSIKRKRDDSASSSFSLPYKLPADFNNHRYPSVESQGSANLFASSRYPPCQPPSSSSLSSSPQPQQLQQHHHQQPNASVTSGALGLGLPSFDLPHFGGVGSSMMLENSFNPETYFGSPSMVIPGGIGVGSGSSNGSGSGSMPLGESPSALPPPTAGASRSAGRHSGSQDQHDVMMLSSSTAASPYNQGCPTPTTPKTPMLTDTTPNSKQASPRP
ncbi:serine/threonine protein kinase [Dimargaris cristalligena]|nr:serine/threonine protein kinase [Dimargaris cristalligena]